MAIEISIAILNFKTYNYIKQEVTLDLKKKIVIGGVLFLALVVFISLVFIKQANSSNLSFDACVLSSDNISLTVLKVPENAADRLCIVRCNSPSTSTRLVDTNGNKLTLSDFAPGDIVRCEVDSLIQYLSPAIYSTTYSVIKTGDKSEDLLREGKDRLPTPSEIE